MGWLKLRNGMASFTTKEMRNEMLVTIKFRPDHTWEEYLLLEDMIDRLDSLREGIEPIEITSIEYENDRFTDR